jgi:metal-responsive CopG/Arc/MetJ family transcriptional regulator
VNSPVRLGRLLLAALDQLAAQRRETRSELIRHFIRAGLIEAGVWPPKDQLEPEAQPPKSRR